MSRKSCTQTHLRVEKVLDARLATHCKSIPERLRIFLLLGFSSCREFDGSAQGAASYSGGCGVTVYGKEIHAPNLDSAHNHKPKLDSYFPQHVPKAESEATFPGRPSLFNGNTSIAKKTRAHLLAHTETQTLDPWKDSRRYIFNWTVFIPHKFQRPKSQTRLLLLPACAACPTSLPAPAAPPSCAVLVTETSRPANSVRWGVRSVCVQKEV